MSTNSIHTKHFSLAYLYSTYTCKQEIFNSLKYNTFFMITYVFFYYTSTHTVKNTVIFSVTCNFSSTV